MEQRLGGSVMRKRCVECIVPSRRAAKAQNFQSKRFAQNQRSPASPQPSLPGPPIPKSGFSQKTFGQHFHPPALDPKPSPQAQPHPASSPPPARAPTAQPSPQPSLAHLSNPQKQVFPKKKTCSKLSIKEFIGTQTPNTFKKHQNPKP